MNFTTYDSAMKSRSASVWPGCKGQGACMPCGRLHDFRNTVSSGRPLHDFHCWQNHVMGCPFPKPEAEHDFNRIGNCRRCGRNRRDVEVEVAS